MSHTACALPEMPELPEMPGLPQDADGTVFSAPWQAQAFAMTLALHERGLFSWGEWAQALSQAISRAQADTLHALEHAWEDAAERTPHGQTIELRSEERALART